MAPATELAQTRRGWRSRWAAIGAAVAVSFGAGGIYIGNATSGSSSSSFVAITPVRVLDTRSNLGLAGVFISPTSRDLLVTGTIATATGPQLVVPAGATAVSMNVTVVGPTVGGFLSVRPADATGTPTTSSLNFTAGQVIPNAVTVQLPTIGGDAGKIEITYNASDMVGPTTHVLVDIVGYYQATAAGPIDGTPCTVNGLPGTIVNGFDHEHNASVKCFLSMVTTFAGEGTATHADGAPGKFNFPQGVAVDAAGIVYVADTDNHRIRKITAAGVVSTLAGATTPGNDDGVGGAAKFSSPTGIAVDAAGNVYVADQGNHRIRKITPIGFVTTLAGDTEGFNDDPDGALALFDDPTGVAVDAAGNVYVADRDNHRIRKITPAGVVTTFAGDGTPGSSGGPSLTAHFEYPRGISIDAAGNVYVADQGNRQIRKITAGTVTTLAGSGADGTADGPGATAEFSDPSGVAVDAAGNVYVADTSNNLIRKVTPTGVVTTVAGSSGGAANGIGAAAQFFTPTGVAVDAAGNVYVADKNNCRIRQIN